MLWLCQESFEANKLLGNAQDELVAIKFVHSEQLKAQENKHKGDLVAMSDSHETQLSKLKKKKKREIANLNIEFENRTKEREKQHMGALVALQEENAQQLVPSILLPSDKTYVDHDRRERGL